MERCADTMFEDWPPERKDLPVFAGRGGLLEG
jgi:hypothetical protein